MTKGMLLLKIIMYRIILNPEKFPNVMLIDLRVDDLSGHWYFHDEFGCLQYCINLLVYLEQKLNARTGKLVYEASDTSY